MASKHKVTDRYHKRFLKIYQQEINPMYRSVIRWLTLTQKAIQYGINTQMIQGLKPDIDNLPVWGKWVPKTKLEKALFDKRVDEYADYLANAVIKAGFTDVTATIVDWKCIRMKGDQRIGQHHVRIHGKAGKLAGQIARISTPFNVINERAVKWAAKNTNKLVTDITKETRKALRGLISTKIKEGKSIAKVGREIRSFVGLNHIQAGALDKFKTKLTAKYSKMPGGLTSKRIARLEKMVAREARKKLRYRAEMIARTETSNALSEGTIEGYKADGMKYMKFVSSADACIECLGYDGNIYRPEEGSGLIPIHPNCRCSWSPLTIEDRPELQAEIAGLTPAAPTVAGTAAGSSISPLNVLRGPKPTVAPEAPAFAEMSPEAIGERLVYQEDLGGSTGARLFKDKATGKKWAVKHGGAEGQAAEEQLANTLYKELGVNVPESHMAVVEGKQAVVNEFRTGTELGKKVLSAEDKIKVRNLISKDFAADAWMGNWDVVGTGYDNVLVRGENVFKVFRIDNGGALRYRAQGAAKAFGPNVAELHTMLDSTVNKTAAKIFAHLSDKEKIRQIRKLGKGMTDSKLEKILNKSLVNKKAKVYNILTQRRDTMLQYADELELKVKSAARARKTAFKTGGNKEYSPEMNEFIAQMNDKYPQGMKNIDMKVVTNEWRGYAEKVYGKQHNVVIDELLNSWVSSSNSNGALIIKEFAEKTASRKIMFHREVFYGNDAKLRKSLNRLIKIAKDDLEYQLKNMYGFSEQIASKAVDDVFLILQKEKEFTKFYLNELKGLKGKKIRLGRGVNSRVELGFDRLAPELRGKPFKYRQNGVVSTTDRNIRFGNIGTFFEVDVDDVLFSHLDQRRRWSKLESEFVAFGGDRKVVIDKIVTVVRDIKEELWETLAKRLMNKLRGSIYGKTG